MDEIERKLRKLAKGSGFAFKRSTMPKSAENRGGFQLWEISTNRVVAGRHYELLDLKDVARELQRLHVLGRGGGDRRHG